MNDNILEPNINGLPPITDWQKVFLVLQQANEAFLRGATLPELGKQIIGDVQIQGADFVDLPVAEDSTPVALPIPETGNKFGFLADGKFTQPTGGTLEYSATQWGLTLFDGDKWVKKFTLELPKTKGGAVSIGSPSTFVFDFDNSVVKTRGAILKVDNESITRGNTTEEISFLNLPEDSVLITYDKVNNLIKLVGAGSSTDTSNLYYLGVIRKSLRVLEFNGLYTISDNIGINYTQKDVHPTVVSLGSASTVNVKFSTNEVVLNNAVFLKDGVKLTANAVVNIAKIDDATPITANTVLVYYDKSGVLRAAGADMSLGKEIKIALVVRKDQKKVFINGFYSIEGNSYGNSVSGIAKNVGSPGGVSVSFINQRVVLTNAYIDTPNGLFTGISKTLDFSSVTDDSAVVVIDPYTGAASIFGVSQTSDISKNFVLGTLRKSIAVAIFNGQYQINNDNVIPSTLKDLTQPTAYSISRDTAVVINWNTKTIIFTGVYIKYKGVNRTFTITLDWSNITSTHILIGFNTETNTLELAGLTTANDTYKLAVLGYLRTTTKEVFYNGRYTEVGGNVAPVEENNYGFMYDGTFRSARSIALPDPFRSASYEELVKDIFAVYDSLVADFPDRVTKTVYGQDDFGNDLVYYNIDCRYFTNSVTQNYVKKDTIMITTLTHGYERPAAITVAAFIDEMLRNPGNLSELRLLRNSVRFVIIPVLNPSGGKLNSRQNGNGVDINRNFVTGWKHLSPGDVNYAGEEPLSEKESKFADAIMNMYKDSLFMGMDRHSDTGYSTVGNGFAGWVVSHLSEVRPMLIGVSKWANSWMIEEEGMVEKFGNKGVFRYYNYAENEATVESRYADYKIPSVLLETDTSVKSSNPLDHQKFHATMVGNIIFSFCQKYLKL
ncbi:M14 family metallopeptidase [Sphingobacterium sp.]|uniref:M14 family metallopeptidase n=1 Tax=Sphingobacterium sp. TaxID=341027 RepID=UPI0028A17776|nr:M14 family metallopeptidase [Sphingobacterium sp.]